MFSFLYNWIFYSIFSFFWFIFITLPFKFLAIITNLFHFLGNSLFNVLYFGSKNGENVKWSEVKLPLPFMIFIIVSIILFFLFLLLTIIKISFLYLNGKNSLKDWKKFFKFVPIILLFILTPMFIYVLIFIINNFFKIINNSFFNYENIAQNIFSALKPEDVSDVSWNGISKDNQFNPLPFEEYKNLKSSSALIIFFPFITGTIISFILFDSLIKLTMKTFQHFFLFIISPFVFITIIYDNGQRFKIWKELFIFKIFIIFAFLIGIQLFTFYSGIINQWINSLKLNSFSKKIFLLITLIGGALSTKELIKLLSRIFGERISMKDLFKETKLIFQESKYFYKNKEVINQKILEKIRFDHKVNLENFEKKSVYNKENFNNWHSKEIIANQNNYENISKDEYYLFYKKLVN